MVGAIHQFVPVLLPGDATGQHTIQTRSVARDLGVESEIFAEGVHPDLEGEGRHFTEYPKQRRRGDVLVYQMSSASVLADFLRAQSMPYAVDYHNVTPPHFFRRWERRMAADQVWSLAQVTGLAADAALGIGDSDFNRADLIGMGYESTTVVPILVDLDAFGEEADEATSDQLDAAKRAGGSDWLFVGRIAPNKAQHDLVKALAVYRRLYDPNARLSLVGRPTVRSYGAALRNFVWELGLAGHVRFTERVTHAELASYYRAADVLVSCSEHEGFCVPLLEAMHHGVPIVAFAAAAVPETLGAAGILLGDKSPLEVASAVDRVLRNPVLRDRLVSTGRTRLGSFSLVRTRRQMGDALSALLSARG